MSDSFKHASLLTFALSLLAQPTWAATDFPWAAISDHLVAEANAGHSIETLFFQAAPELKSALHEDSKRESFKKMWGKSINYDELAKDIIVHPAILAMLADQMKIPLKLFPPMTRIRADKPDQEATAELRRSAEAMPTDEKGHTIVHAGMEHTYGYLFSTLKTPFGYKRARWNEGEMTRGFDLPAGTLGPSPKEGTLFANVTYFGGSIAFRDEPGTLTLLKKGAAGIPKSLLSFNYSALRPTRLVEKVFAEDELGNKRLVTLRTDLVPFLSAQKNTHLLIYSIHDPLRGAPVLITLFPVTQAFVNTVLKPSALGKDQAIQTRYNGFVAGVSGKILKGSRLIQTSPSP